MLDLLATKRRLLATAIILLRMCARLSIEDICLDSLTLLWQNVFAPLFFKDLLSAIWALLRRRPKDEIDDGVTYGGHGWLGRRPVD
ncbi:hypothetical protein AB4Z51_37140, partial [Bradyrhizobium sp. 2TAF36]|uniref:hypothetical protein n=1 Tax=Bradyrhizobium sp. 2TAF36 TaxID=3233016 RepID=UPI003F92B7AA